MQQLTLVNKEQALADRAQVIAPGDHAIYNDNMARQCQPHEQEIVLAMGCFWGVERLFWQMQGVTLTSVGYAGGISKNPTYEDVCSGLTGHTEVVRLVFDASQVSLLDILVQFWQNHDPTQGMRQGNDIGTQYRSAIYALPEQMVEIEPTRKLFQQQLKLAGLGLITTEIKTDQPFYYAERYHQQYLHKNPNGYCGLRGTGVTCI